MTANKPMTGEQLDELMTVAVNMQRDSEKSGDRPTAMFAYAVQVAVLELRKVRNHAAKIPETSMSIARYWISPNGIACEDNEGKFVRYEDFAVLEARCAALAAENAGLRAQLRELFNSCDTGERRGNGSLSGAAVPDWCVLEKTRQFLESTPATDAFLAEVRAQARNEGINYAASRLAAAFNHGFVDKPLTEVCDVVRMILDTKEELANSTLPAADGLSGEYAEKFLEDSAAQLRKGVQS